MFFKSNQYFYIIIFLRQKVRINEFAAMRFSRIAVQHRYVRRSAGAAVGDGRHPCSLLEELSEARLVAKVIVVCDALHRVARY